MNPSQNDSFDSFGVPSNSMGGDFSLGSDESVVVNEPIPQKSSRKKWWVIVLVILLIIGLCGGVVFALWSGGVFSSHASDAEKVETSREAFSEYVDYLESIKDWYFEEGQLDELEKYYYVFADNTALDVSEYTHLFKLFTTSIRHYLPPKYIVFGKYYDEGRAATGDYLAGIVDNYKDFTNVYGVDYYDLTKKWSTNVLKIASIYNSAGCLNSDGDISECVVAISSAEYNELEGEIEQIENNLDIVQGRLREELLYDTWLIEEAIEEEDVTNEPKQ